MIHNLFSQTAHNSSKVIKTRQNRPSLKQTEWPKYMYIAFSEIDFLTLAGV